MNTGKAPLITLIACLVSMTFSAGALAQRAGQSATIRTGQVTSVQTVDLKDGNAVGGALVGGAFGAALSGTSSSSRSRNRNAAIGALLGGAAASNQTQQGRIFTVLVNDGSMIQVATEQTEIRIADCVFVEQSGGGTNIRRAPATACEPETTSVLADKDVESELQRDASICFSARQELADAQDDASFDRAARKVKLLCYD
jgi:outer membrane lipoprotein SlyB